MYRVSPTRGLWATKPTTPTNIWNRIRKFTRSSKIGVEEIFVETPPRRLAERRKHTVVGRPRPTISLAPRPSHFSKQPNYTSRACSLADKDFEDDEVASAREIFEELLDTPSGRNFVHLQATVLKARKRGTMRIMLRRESAEIPWGVLFFKPSQLKALGWISDQYLIVNKLKTASPAMQDGLAVGDVIVGVNGEKIRDYNSFISLIKSACSLSLLIVRPDTNADEDEEDIQCAEKYLMQRVLNQARKNAQASVLRMRRLGSGERLRLLDQCV